MDRKITIFLNKFDILSVKQSGFRAGYSCATAMADITDDIVRAVDENKVTALILLVGPAGSTVIGIVIKR